MKRVINVLFSTRFTLILLLIFAVSLGTATFIEEKYDTVTAQLLVYRAHWFELVLFLLALNFTGNIFRFKMVSGKKYAMLLFHLAFIVVILGAGVTRYLGFEGNMHIREGESTGFIYSSVPYLEVEAINNGSVDHYERELVMSPFLNNNFHIRMKNKAGKGPIDIKYKNYFTNAVEQVAENVPGGSDMLEIIYATDNIQHSLFLKKGQKEAVGNYIFSYDNVSDTQAIRFSNNKGKWTVTSPVQLLQRQMAGETADTIKENSSIEIDPSKYFTTGNISFMFKASYQNAKKIMIAGPEGSNGAAALILDISVGGRQQEVTVTGGPGVAGNFTRTVLDGQEIRLAYGDKKIDLPFSLHLDDFILDRYAGSMSPSSYASDVTLIDNRNNLREKHRIFMNNVLDYQGYRFFQSSYDTDEKGTILSVNHDVWGTWITYLGYFLLAVGFILTLLNKNSRFRTLSNTIKELRSKRRAAMAAGIVMLMGMVGPAFSQQAVKPALSAEQADRFGHLLVQTFDGRFEPVHTLAYDVMHKVSRKDNFDIPGKGSMNALQVYLDLMMDGPFWQQQKIIYIREKSVRDLLGLQDKYASLLDFYDQNSKYKLAQVTETSFRKKPSEQNTFDKEIIKLDERLNVFISALNGSSLKIFPLAGSPVHRWLSPGDSLAYVPLSGQVAADLGELQLNPPTYISLLRLYFIKTAEASTSGNYGASDKIVSIIESVQRKYTPAELLPSASMVNLEIYYDKAEIFIKLRNWYGILSLVLLTLAFIDIVRTKKSNIIKWALRISIGILALTFAYYTYGMGLRWYLSGHAPWSNGYEALLLMAWGSLLAGFSFARYSKITLAATVVLAASMLMTASHSSYDPQLTNLQPVLKSYWLIIHVAVITISYGFLGLGFALGLINTFISLFKNSRNKLKLTLIGEELTHINEMNLTIGLFLATLGTFLGGIWASESWGRYWGWDAKETWALVIVIVYAILLHFRLVPKMKSAFIFNAGSIVAFGSVLMTFVGVNYYLSKGLHSYAADDTKVFPLWAWGMILAVLLLLVAAGLKERNLKRASD